MKLLEDTLLLLLVFGSFPGLTEQTTVQAKGFDAFLFLPVEANRTCGTPAEQYYNTKEGYVTPRSRVLSVCDASNPALARPPTLMTDGNATTSWQSTNNQDKAYITIKLHQVR